MSNPTTCQTLEDYLTRSKDAIIGFEAALEAAKESGDFSEVERLAEEVEELKGQLSQMEKLIPARDSFELLERFKEMGLEVIRISVTNKAIDGTLAGGLILKDGSRYPFKGDKIIKTIGGEEVVDAFYIHIGLNDT